jgi:DNA-directed RNA polymerase specialized sigma24 family protein
VKRMRWCREMPPTPAVDEARFQDESEPYPRHWREFPQTWPPGTATDPEAAEVLAAGLADLPPTWREVLTEADVRHRNPRDVAADLGLDRGQERAIRNRARAVLRERLARLVTRRGDR